MIQTNTDMTLTSGFVWALFIFLASIGSLVYFSRMAIDRMRRQKEK